MRQTNIIQILTLMLVFSMFIVGLVIAEPSTPTDTTWGWNTTTAYPNGTVFNKTRGYIYQVNITESAPTNKWVGYVGHVSGEFALQDSTGDSLYDWPIGTIKGELYATREGGIIHGDIYDAHSSAGYPYAGGIPVWSNLTCANGSMINRESGLYNHSTSDEDRFNVTFVDTGFKNPGFYAGAKEVLDTTSVTAAKTCYGAYLNYNNTDGASDVPGGNWTMIVTTDVSGQFYDSTEGEIIWDLIYVSLLQNESSGFNNATYDFQIMLPQTGESGDRPRITFYFYIELM